MTRFRGSSADAHPCITNIKLKYYSDRNESAECDVRVFWQLVNNRRKVRSSMVNKLNIGQRVANDPEEISQTFADHFSSIYIPKNHAILNIEY